MKEEYEFDLFMESSAKTGFNAKEIFIEAAKLLYKDYLKYSKVNFLFIFYIIEYRKRYNKYKRYN